MPPSMQEIAAHTLAVTEALGHVDTAAQALRSALEAIEATPQRWQHYLLQPPFAREAAHLLQQDFDAPFQLAAALFAQLDHPDHPDAPTDARQTLQVPGLLAVPEHIIPLATALNTHKLRFAAAVADLRQCLADRPASERDQAVRDALAAAGHPRAHLRQCYRQVLLCEKAPDALSLSWVKARKSIRAVTVQWCERKLVQMDPQGADPGIQYQRQLLADLPQRQHGDLRQVQVQARPNLQVAEIVRDGEAEHYRQVGYATMPVLVPGNARGGLPEFTRVGDTPPEGRRRQRRDLALGGSPYLPALRVYLRQPAG